MARPRAQCSPGTMMSCLLVRSPIWPLPPGCAGAFIYLTVPLHRLPVCTHWVLLLGADSERTLMNIDTHICTGCFPCLYLSAYFFPPSRERLILPIIYAFSTVCLNSCLTHSITSKHSWAAFWQFKCSPAHCRALTSLKN